jgi:TonB family protein
MKHQAFTLLLSLALFSGSAQPPKFEYTGKLTPTTNKAKLSEAAFLNDITPELWRNMVLPSYERMDLNRRRMAHFQGYDVFPLGYNYLSPQEHNYNKIIDYLSVNITSVHNGKTVTAHSSNDQLSIEQKRILATADLNTEVSIHVKFKYKNDVSSEAGGENKIIEGKLAVTVAPETEAQFPGGYTELKDQLTKSVMSKLPSGGAAASMYADKISRTVVKFTVNEEGKVVDVSIATTSTDPFVDTLLIDAAYHLPKWKAAKNAKGKPVKQQFNFSLGGGGC